MAKVQVVVVVVGGPLPAIASAVFMHAVVHASSSAANRSKVKQHNF